MAKDFIIRSSSAEFLIFERQTHDKGIQVRFENGAFFDEDYYDSLLAEIREIRLSERRFYQKVTDI